MTDREVNRDAGTGKFVSHEDALADPDGTVTESITAGAGESSAPSIGRIVHYVSYGTPGGEYHSECRAAMITEVRGPGEVSLTVFNPSGMFFNVSTQDEDTHKGGSWHWPERV